MDVCLLLMSCVVRQRSVRRADQSSRGVLPSVVRLGVIVRPRQEGGHGPLKAVSPWKKRKNTCTTVMRDSNYSHARKIFLWNGPYRLYEISAERNISGSFLLLSS
jgi:hypothetical protein